jgi:alpha-1,3-fucosyltransferase
VILFWTEFFGDKLWSMKNETYYESDLKQLGCPISNCIVTHDKNYLKSSHLYDAIIYHAPENWGKFPNIPLVRSSDQLYIMASLESPDSLKHDLKSEHNLYNLTMTYRLDSDILWSYGSFKDKLTNQIVAPNYNPIWRKFDENEEISLGKIDIL